NISRKIVSSLQNAGEQQVIEVGPGTGVLTKYLLEQYSRFTAFDVDQESIKYLMNAYPDHASKFLQKDFLQHSFDSQSVVIGNFPYNISSQIFFKIWENKNNVTEVVGMIQKEVAERIASKHGTKQYGILSVLLQAFYDIELLFAVPPSVFNPPPKVDSAVIRLMRNTATDLGCDVKLFKKLVKAGFGKRRKTLRNALKEFHIETNENAFFDKRAEQLSVENFISLTKFVEKQCPK
ncbi:MAG: 16S rRNA (adenine(1518)-N(6)/adenine(1519)-N(6))-dimethyltransferase RsmA, partial [Bacteroidota bacterium]